MAEHTVELEAGRKLQVQEAGDPRGKPVFVLHGTPGARTLYPPFSKDAAAKGIRLIGYDRPGYGGSTAVPGRRIVDTAADVEGIANDLGLDRLAVWGWSGGGAPALACAASLPGRVVAAASFAGVAPYPAEGLDWIAGSGESNVEDFRLMLHDPRAWEAKIERDREEMLAASAEQIREIFASLLSEVDRAALDDEFGNFLFQQVREALRRSGAGMRDDNLSTVQPWGFDVGSIRVPVQLWHGGHDLFVPFSHGRWLARHMPQAEAHLEAEEGHISLLLHRVAEAHSWLASRF